MNSMKIVVSGIQCFGKHGVFPAEKQTPQLFLVDLECLLRRSDPSDELSNTIDYSQLAQIAVNVISKQSYNLIETIAEQIAVVCLKNDNLEQIIVRVHKPHAPMPCDVQDCYIELVADRG